MRLGAILFAAGLSAALAGAALAQPGSSNPPHHRESCVSPEFIDGISAPNTHTAYLSIGPSDVWRLDVAGDCMNLDWPMTPKRLVDKMGRGGDICDAHDMVIIVGHGQRCYVNAMHKLTPAEIQAWRSGKH